MNSEYPKPLRIYSLGHFSVTSGEQPILAADGGMSKIWNIFKYLLTNRDRAVPGEVIADIFWKGISWPKSRHCLYNSIYRLRLTLEGGSPPMSTASVFVIRDGMYSLNRSSGYWLDCDEFESLCSRAHELSSIAEDTAFDLYKKAIRLYRGDYLSENLYDDWVKAAQIRMRSIYKKALLEYCELLERRHMYAEVLDVCERALTADSLDEDIETTRIKALISVGNLAEAKESYQRFSSLIYKENGVYPSKQMRRLYQEIQLGGSSRGATDLETIQELLDTGDMDGAYLCDQESFHSLYLLERRRVFRTGLSAYLMKMDLNRADFSIPSVKELERVAVTLQNVLQQTLRRGDVFCRWNDTQFLVILPMVIAVDTGKVIKRISNQFKQCYSGPVLLRVRERPIQPLQEKTVSVMQRI